MLARYFLIFAVLFTVTACGTTDDDAVMFDDQVTAERDVITTADPLSDIYGETTYDETNGAIPGSQEDLIVNVGDRVLFATDSSDINAEGMDVLGRQANWLAQYPNISIIVEGHADERGTREYNLALGERRANAVENYLVALGIDPRRIDTVTFGKERPAVVGDNAEAWAQNRRGVAIIK